MPAPEHILDPQHIQVDAVLKAKDIHKNVNKNKNTNKNKNIDPNQKIHTHVHIYTKKTETIRQETIKHIKKSMEKEKDSDYNRSSALVRYPHTNIKNDITVLKMVIVKYMLEEVRTHALLSCVP